MEGICKNCGGDAGLHHYKTNQCPTHGREAPVGKKQEFKTSTFEHGIPYEELLRQRDALLEALRAAKAQLTGVIIPMGAARPGTALNKVIVQVDTAIAQAEKEG